MGRFLLTLVVVAIISTSIHVDGKSLEVRSGETCKEGEVKLEPDGTPSVFWDGKWSPICGHWFWNNDHGATKFCKKLGYMSGKKERINEQYSETDLDGNIRGESLQIGMCRDDDKELTKCSRNMRYCGTKDKVAIRITCFMEVQSDTVLSSCGGTSGGETTDEVTTAAAAPAAPAAGTSDAGTADEVTTAAAAPAAPAAEPKAYYVDDGCHDAAQEKRKTDDFEGRYQAANLKAGVRCCSIDGETIITTPNNGKKRFCKTLGRCNKNNGVTFAEAVEKCTGEGLRLCTKVELMSDECCGTGGDCDSHLVWTSTPEETAVVEATSAATADEATSAAAPAVSEDTAVVEATTAATAVEATSAAAAAVSE